LQLRNPHSLRSTLRVIVAALCVWRPSAYAQDPSPSPASDDSKERVILAHPYYATAESFTALRVTVIRAELKKGGDNTPIETLRQVPSFVGTTRTENDSIGGDGSASINLYALGARNVVTLINGRRAFGFSNINAIPLSAVASVEVIDTSVYGSDATAGVVNFILLNGPGEAPYEGAELGTLYGNTTDSDAHVRQVYLRGGVTGLDGKVSIAAAAEYYSRAALFSRDREISRSGDLSNDATGLGLGGPNNNSPTFAGRVSLSGSIINGGGQRVLIDLTNNAPTRASYREFDFPPGTDPSRFNFRAFTPAIPAVEKAMFFVTGRYKIFGDGLQLHGDILHSITKQDNAISPTPIAFTSIANGLGDVRSSPFNPFSGNTLTSLRYRTVQELGLRQSFYEQDYYRYVAGLNGDFDWHENGFISRFGYDIGFVYERADTLRTDNGDFTREGIRNQIRLGVFDPFIGQFAPTAGIAPTYTNGMQTGTRAYDNIAGARAASYIGHSFSYERDWLADAKMNAHLFPSWLNGGIDLAVGYEHREVNPKQTPDAVQASHDQVGFDPVPLFKFRQEVESWFVELSVPLITSNMSVPLVRSLDLDIAWRREEFRDTNLLRVTGSPVRTSASFVNENPDENFGGAPSVSLRYQTNPDLMFRASWRQSIRPPAFDELFAPITQTFPAFFGPGIFPLPSQGIFIGGNPSLRPETTDAYSAGVVWSPEFFQGFVVTMDAYQMFTTNVVLDPDSVTQMLLATNTVDPDGCGLGVLPGSGPAQGVTRDRFNGAVDCVDSGFANGGKRLVEGLEITLSYEMPTERFGRFTFTGGWNHFFSWKAQPGLGSPTTSFLGNFNNRTLPFAPGAIPWNKGFLRGEWGWRDFDFVAMGNYVGDFRDDPAFDSVTRSGRRNVPSYVTLDLQLSYERKKPEIQWAPPAAQDAKNPLRDASSATIWQRLLWGTKITVGVNNAFDRNPPTVLAALNDNYDTSLYSIRNRYWYVAVSKRF
jgi:iron complex outermembrane recepter protein